MKKILNDVDNVVIEMCEGMAKAHPELEFLRDSKIIKLKDINKEKVTLISGGGSGHEPAHAGFVGKGMLDVAVCGDVFASPSTVQVYKAICASESNKGTLLIIKNYSGDIMNFEAAAEMAEEDDDITVEKVYVNDDVAVKDSLYTVGRRGVAGTVFVHKLAGAAAAKGLDLAGVKAAAEKVIANVRSMGFGLTSCTVPAKGTPTFDITEEELELGVGIHGEPGTAREKMSSSKELAKKLVDKIAEDTDFKSGEKVFNSGDEVALMINGMGATPMQELYLFNNDVSAEVEAKGLKIYKTFVGNYMTSIDMAGASVTLLRLDDELKELLDAEADTSAFKI